MELQYSHTLSQKLRVNQLSIFGVNDCFHLLFSWVGDTHNIFFVRIQRFLRVMLLWCVFSFIPVQFVVDCIIDSASKQHINFIRIQFCFVAVAPWIPLKAVSLQCSVFSVHVVFVFNGCDFVAIRLNPNFCFSLLTYVTRNYGAAFALFDLHRGH